ncbi:MAG: protein kinase, partial [Pirellulales bacterium]|nr:protein kinase [Pirellulales bacterium]
PGADRCAYLDDACAVDDGLRRRVEGMLAAEGEAGNFLQCPPPPPGATSEWPLTEHPGSQIGAYKLLEQIGEGGFGVVFMAEQERPVRRRVALKVIKPGMDTRQVIARFEAERQALALLDHPNISRVLDAGATESGRPYFVMELVRGVPLTDFCDKNRLTVGERLELFNTVCHAVQHAHQKGIIHRDVKPTNVLVTLHDGAPVAKLIDFGVAKATGQRLTEKTLFTGFAQMVGTPLYMSPEQAEMSGLDIDTRSDIYSLGVMLYELLTGTTPFDQERLRTAGCDEVRRIIREEEPDRPSARISTLALAATTISANRRTDAIRLSQSFRGELDWIVMKALEKDRNRRYETADAFAADIQRYLNDEPVQACPATAWYRLRKFARRNKAVFVTGSVVAVALLVAIGSLISGVLVLAASNATVRQEQFQTREALDREKGTSYSRSIALAERRMSAGNVGGAEELLDECPPELRGWEWNFLKRQRYGNAAPLEHSDTVVRVTFSPNGREIASGCLDGTVRIWDSQTGQNLHTLRCKSPLVRALAYSPDGQLLAAGYNDGVICVWTASTGELFATLRGHEQTVWQVAFSPDGRTLASGGQDRSVRIWNIERKQDGNADPLIRILADQPAHVTGVGFSSDGGRVLAACRDGTVKTWDVSTGEEASSFRRRLPYVDNACFSPDGRQLAWSCQDGFIKVWNLAAQREVFAVQSNTHFGRSVAFSPNGRLIALAGFDGTVRLLDASTGRETLTIYAHPSLVSGVAFSPDGHRLASASYDKTIRIWDATPLGGDPLAAHCVTLTEHKQQVYGVAFSPSGRWLASASWDGTVKVWEFADVGASQLEPEPKASLSSSLPREPGGITLRYTLRGHSDNVIAVAFSPDKQTLASASWDNTVKLWDLDSPPGDSLSERRTIPCRDRIYSIGFSPDGRLLAIGQRDGIDLYDPNSGNKVYPFKKTLTPAPAVTFSPDSRRLISAGATDPSTKIWDVAGEEPMAEIRHDSNPNSAVAISPDGRFIATPGPDQTVKLWDAETRAELRTLRGHVGYIWRVAFSPDGRYLASGSWDSTIKVWDLKAPELAEPVTLRGHAGFIRSLAFSPDGRRLASASGYAGHGEIKVWDAALWNGPSQER